MEMLNGPKVCDRYLFDDANENVGDVQKAIECFMRGAQLGNANCMLQFASYCESRHGGLTGFCQSP